VDGGHGPPYEVTILAWGVAGMARPMGESE